MEETSSTPAYSPMDIDRHVLQNGSVEEFAIMVKGYRESTAKMRTQTQEWVFREWLRVHPQLRSTLALDGRELKSITLDDINTALRRLDKHIFTRVALWKVEHAQEWYAHHTAMESTFLVAPFRLRRSWSSTLCFEIDAKYTIDDVIAERPILPWIYAHWFRLEQLDDVWCDAHRLLTCPCPDQYWIAREGVWIADEVGRKRLGHGMRERARDVLELVEAVKKFVDPDIAAAIDETPAGIVSDSIFNKWKYRFIYEDGFETAYSCGGEEVWISFYIYWTSFRLQSRLQKVVERRRLERHLEHERMREEIGLKAAGRN